MQAAYFSPPGHKLVYLDWEGRAVLEKLSAPLRGAFAGRMHSMDRGCHGGKPLRPGRGGSHARILSPAEPAAAAGAGRSDGGKKYEPVHPAMPAPIASAVGGLRCPAGGGDSGLRRHPKQHPAGPGGNTHWRARRAKQPDRWADLCRQRRAQPDGDPQLPQELHRRR